MKSVNFHCRQLLHNRINTLEEGAQKAEIFHAEGDPAGVHRIRLHSSNAQLELFPSKGLSVGEASFHGSPVFWEPPIGMPDPDKLDVWSDEIAIQGKAASGFTFLKTFNGGIELYGLNNWGMPVEKDGMLLPLHGETSNIPLPHVRVDIESEERIRVTGSFVYKTWKGDPSISWYDRGEDLCRIQRSVSLIGKGGPGIEVTDTFENIHRSAFFLDWGYHITFRPEEKAKILVPAKQAEERFGGPLPKDYDTWFPAKQQEIRTENGIIYKGLEKVVHRGIQMNFVQVIRPDLGDLTVEFTPAPYMQTWMCSGGANSREFTLATSGAPLFRKNWDGMGIEIGASALDHNGNTDPDVPVAAPLMPGTQTTVRIMVSPKRSSRNI